VVHPDCPPDDGAHRERNRYSTGRLLTAEDLAREQEYHRAALRRHNRALHGWGVASGFDVVAAPSATPAVTVAPGYALDPCGREVRLGDPVTLGVSTANGAVVAARAVEAEVYAGVVRDDVEVALVSDPGPEWVVLASVEVVGAEVVVDPRVRRPLALD
jgi:hypothetical protein